MSASPRPTARSAAFRTSSARRSGVSRGHARHRGWPRAPACSPPFQFKSNSTAPPGHGTARGSRGLASVSETAAAMWPPPPTRGVGPRQLARGKMRCRGSAPFQDCSGETRATAINAASVAAASVNGSANFGAAADVSITLDSR
eukprot:TRINITY_DN31845_c0_g1_i1.p2 TRINITY_DN31845_c0_g1~~TRINITY_DN31845_c0_g1_i1.p2  ORF type:complete len:144 (-),score=9.13 TRINITY_DN31845_c0_g1_i1:142-573(-)